MSRRPPLVRERASAVISSVVLASTLMAIAAMLLAALAFAQELIFAIPFVATFDGLREFGDLPRRDHQRFLGAAGISTLLLALPLCIVAFRRRAEPAPR